MIDFVLRYLRALGVGLRIRQPSKAGPTNKDFDALVDFVVIDPEPKQGMLARTGRECLPMRGYAEAGVARWMRYRKDGVNRVRIDIYCMDVSRTGAGRKLERSLGSIRQIPELSRQDAGGFEDYYRGTVVMGKDRGETQDWLLVHYR